MQDHQYEWDDEKNEKNLSKHGISFDEAKTVFGDPFSITHEDKNHSSSKERRYSIVGLCQSGKIITVIFTLRRNIIRLISAQERRKERKTYEKNKQEEITKEED